MFPFRIALDLDAPPLETGTFGDTDVRPEDLQEVLAKASTPSSGSGAGSLHAACDEPAGLSWRVGVGVLASFLQAAQPGGWSGWGRSANSWQNAP